MDKNKQKSKPNRKKVDNKGINKDHEDYGYDFVPQLDAWLNVDEQKDKAHELEDI